MKRKLGVINLYYFHRRISSSKMFLNGVAIQLSREGTGEGPDSSSDKQEPTLAHADRGWRDRMIYQVVG